MSDKKSLQRFVSAQEQDYQKALAEIRAGHKRSHWMWYIFPQIRGLGLSETARFYNIADIGEAALFFSDPVLGRNLKEISNALLELKEDNANRIFGSPDDLKLKSSMTLFASLEPTDPVFQKVLDKYFNGEKDMRTLELLARDVQ